MDFAKSAFQLYRIEQCIILTVWKSDLLSSGMNSIRSAGNLTLKALRTLHYVPSKENPAYNFFYFLVNFIPST